MASMGNSYGNPGYGNQIMGNNYNNGFVNQPNGYNPNQQIQYVPNPTPNYFQSSQPQRITMSAIPGRMINSIDEVKPNEVPGDGSISIFPTIDGSSIYVKMLNKDGLIVTMKFIEEPKTQQIVPTEMDNFTAIMNRLDKIEKMVSKPYKRKNYNPNYGKEVINNESSSNGTKSD